MLRNEKWLDEQLFDIQMRLRLISQSIRKDAEGLANPVERECYVSISEGLRKSSVDVGEARIYYTNALERSIYEQFTEYK